MKQILNLFKQQGQEKRCWYLGLLIILFTISLSSQSFELISIEAPQMNDDVGIFQVNDNVWAADKQLHWFGAAVLGFALKTLFYHFGFNDTWSSVFAWFSVMTLGAIKELTDPTGFDFDDMAANGAGGALGVLGAGIILDLNFNKSPQKLRQINN